MEWQYIVVHHSLTGSDELRQWGVITDDHINNRGFDDNGYHFGIGKQRGKYEVIVGRMLDTVGAHIKGHNRNSIGVCVLGNFDLAPPSKEQWIKTVQLCKSLSCIFEIRLNNIMGHRERVEDDRTCPGKMFDMQKFRDDVARLIIGKVIQSEDY